MQFSEETAEVLAWELAVWYQGFLNPDYPIEELGSLSLELSASFRALAIIFLLIRGDSKLFYQNLIRSGETRETYLQRLKHQGIDQDHHQASGRYDPLLDAVAAGDFALARHIANISLTEWHPGHEYEDDYCYAQILHRFVAEQLPKEEIPPLLSRFEAYVEGNPSARLALCWALAQQNQDSFDEAFNDLLNEQEDRIAAAKARGQMDDPIIVSQRLVFVEGLAILRLAEMRVLKTQNEYRYCPSLARV